jgi:phage tail sheath gpL-like
VPTTSTESTDSVAVDLQGVALSGDTWTVGLTGESDFTHTVDVSYHATLSGVPTLGEIWTVELANGEISEHSYRVGVSGTNVSVTLNGTPTEDEVWSIFLDGEEFAYTVQENGSLDSLADIAEELRILIDATAFTAMRSGETLTIIGAAFDLTYAIETVAASEEAWIALQSTDGNTDTAADIATALAADINVAAAVPDADFPFSASATGGLLSIVNTDDEAFTASASILAAGSDTFGFISLVQGDTLAYVASQLADAINTDGTYTATARDEILTMLGGASFTFTGSIDPADGQVLPAPVAPTTSMLELKVDSDTGDVGVLVPGQTWTATIAGTPYDHLVTFGQNLADIASALAILINADNADDTPTGFAATSYDDLLIVINEAETVFTSSVDAAAASTAYVDASPSSGSTAKAMLATLTGNVNPGEFWRVEIEGRIYAVEGGATLEVDELGEVTDSVDTIAEVVALLAAGINADDWSAAIELTGTPAYSRRYPGRA